MVTTLSRPSLPQLPRVVPLPGGMASVEPPSLERITAKEPDTDEFGLSLAVYGEYPREQRRLAAKMITELGGNKRARPPAGATIAEAVFFGLLLDAGFEWTNALTVTQGKFRFQSYELGGRQPGGAVTDFYINHNGTRIAVRVQSVYHSLIDPFGGGGQIQAREIRLKAELLASRFIDFLADVNEPPERVLETSENPARVRQELDRALGYAA